MSDQLIQAQLQEIILNIQGLRQEIESWRHHSSSNADFFLDVLRDQLLVMQKIYKSYDKP